MRIKKGLMYEVANIDLFLKSVDAIAVYVNTSTIFMDGSQLDHGIEIGISTQKFHALSPMAVRGMAMFKWILRGIV